MVLFSSYIMFYSCPCSIQKMISSISASAPSGSYPLFKLAPKRAAKA